MFGYIASLYCTCANCLLRFLEANCTPLVNFCTLSVLCVGSRFRVSSYWSSSDTEFLVG